MPRFFFNLHDDRDLPDPTGTDLPSLAKARRVAIERVGAILAEADERGVSSTDWQLDVTDERGIVLAWFRVETGNIPSLDEMRADWRTAVDGSSARAAAADGAGARNAPKRC